MTFIATFQGNNCALLASDLQIRFAKQDQLQLPERDRTYETLISEKFRKKENGDYVAFNGSLNSLECMTLSSKSLRELQSKPLADDPLVRTDRLVVFYVSVEDAQIYAANFTQPLIRAQCGQPFMAEDTGMYASGLLDITQRTLKKDTREYNERFLRMLSADYEEYFLKEEKKTYVFGGFASYIVTPQKVELLTRNVGKLKGNKEALIDSNGMVSY